MSVSRATRAAVPPDHVLILFGATGDLAKRKLLPACSISPSPG
jgi:glucose-6-phosphate 1-dehydrogenase